MAHINVYLTFNGNCREAMTFYHSCLGGSINIMSFGDTPHADSLPENERDLVMHSTVTNGKLMLMASDSTSHHGKVTTGSSITLSMNCDSEAEIDELFSKLSAGGNVTMPLEDTFWNAKFGMLIDKYGIPWMFNFERSQK